MATSAATRTAGAVCAVVVTFHPDPSELRGVLEQAAAQTDRVVVVDNTPAAEGPSPARSCVTEVETTPARERRKAPVRLIEPGRNLGLARAYNLGIAEAEAGGCALVLFLDQDSVLQPGAIDRLIEQWATADGTVGAVSCENVEQVAARLPTDRLLEKIRSGPRGHRGGPAAPAPDDRPRETRLFTNSGTLIPVDTIRRVGGFNERLFLDAVDYDFSLRLRDDGLKLLLAPGAKVTHRMGEQYSRRLFGSKVEVRTYPPRRSYHIVRDTLWFGRDWFRRHPRTVGGIVATMTITTLTGLVVLPHRRARVAEVLRALADFGHRQ
jgi:rhamnosyltransferase